MRRVSKRKQRVEVRIGDEHHISAATAVATVRPTLGDELLSMKADTAITALATSDVDPGFVDHEHDSDLRMGRTWLGNERPVNRRRLERLELEA
jgi:hypothetical protein